MVKTDTIGEHVFRRRRERERTRGIPSAFASFPRGRSALQFLSPYLVSGWLKRCGGSLPWMRTRPDVSHTLAILSYQGCSSSEHAPFLHTNRVSPLTPF